MAVRKKPYAVARLSAGLILLYRRNHGNGSWIIKAATGDGATYWTKAFAEANDFCDANPDKNILTFFQAQERARELARGGDPDASNSGAPITVDEALTRYAANLEARACITYQAEHVRIHLTPAILSKPVMLLDAAELVKWRDSLPAKGLKPSSINRILKPFRAALNLAARNDRQRITNADAWKAAEGLGGLPSANEPRSVFLTDAEMLDFVGKAYGVNDHFGEFAEVLAQTGARPSQAGRVLVRHLLNHPTQPRMAMPKSGKGGSKDRLARKSKTYSVPITPQLARRLAAVAKGRAPDEVLLLQSDGRPWATHNDYREAVRTVVQAMGKDLDEVTIYALRHASIARMLLKGASGTFVAEMHDTSTREIESNYFVDLHTHLDEHARTFLLTAPPAVPHADNVVALGARQP